MVVLLSLSMGFVACSEDDDDEAAVPTGGISGTVTFLNATMSGVDTNDAGAMMYAIALDSSIDCMDQTAVMAAAGTSKSQIQTLDTEVSTADYTISAVPAGSYKVMVTVFQGGVPGEPADEDFVGQYNTLGVSNMMNCSVVDVTDDVVTDINIQTIPYSIISAMMP